MYVDPAEDPLSAEIRGGQKTVQFGGYTWRVLDMREDRALLLSEAILELRPYHKAYTDITWEQCDLRAYLNGAFLGKFSSEDQARIAPVALGNPDNPWFGIEGGGDTTDRIFLLSLEEVVQYFGDSGLLKNRPKDTYGIDDEYNGDRIAKFGSDPEWWWLRSPGCSVRDAAGIHDDGVICVLGDDVNNEIDPCGVRPALWLNLES